MADVLEELTADTLTRAQVERRIDDWTRRIADLYDRIDAWLPEGWHSVRDRRTRLFEEPMREVGLPPRTLPILDLMTGDALAATVEPRSLWIVGANGRLEFRRGSVNHLLLDRSAIFEPPEWFVVPISDRSRAVPLDRAAVTSLLR